MCIRCRGKDGFAMVGADRCDCKCDTKSLEMDQTTGEEVRSRTRPVGVCKECNHSVAT